jgi:aryl-alcohol dehydrogenase-like predicted oxidoreductase
MSAARGGPDLREVAPRRLGTVGLTVAPIGLGCMGLSWAYGSPVEEREAQSVLARALELGVDFFDTAAIYADGENERLLGRWPARTRITIATKFGYEQDDQGRRRLDSSPAAVRRSVEASLRNLRTDRIDLLYQHRVDPAVPIEDTVGAVADLVGEGKVRHLGLSEASAATIRRAHQVFPLSALQMEYSIWERGCEDEILPVLRELGIGLVPYSPLGRGFLAAPSKSTIDLSPGDYRHHDPRFSQENAEKNVEIRRILEAISSENGVSTAEIALAWLLAQGPDIVPIPGTRRIRYLESNVRAAFLNLDGDKAREISQAMPRTAGERYNAALMKTVNL